MVVFFLTYRQYLILNRQYLSIFKLIVTGLCQNGGTTNYLANGAYSCTCASGYTGSNCQYGKLSKIDMLKYIWIIIWHPYN